MFASIYVYKQLFSLNLNKSQYRSQLTNPHLSSTTKSATAQSLVPDINVLVNAKRCHISSSRSAMEK